MWESSCVSLRKTVPEYRFVPLDFRDHFRVLASFARIPRRWIAIARVGTFLAFHFFRIQKWIPPLPPEVGGKSGHREFQS